MGALVIPIKEEEAFNDAVIAFRLYSRRVESPEKYIMLLTDIICEATRLGNAFVEENGEL